MIVPKRGPWEEYFLGLAAQAAARSTCDRLAVGCVLVRDRAVLATGYNGAARGMPHCDENDHGRRPGDPEGCRQVVHAEANAVAIAARNGAATAGAIAYVTHLPCFGCYSLLVNAGIVECVYATEYRPDERVRAQVARGLMPVWRYADHHSYELVELRDAGEITFIRVCAGWTRGSSSSFASVHGTDPAVAKSLGEFEDNVVVRALGPQARERLWPTLVNLATNEKVYVEVPRPLTLPPMKV